MAPTEKPVFCNVTEWLEDNQQYLMPPVSYKMMHGDGQMKTFFVGGPNERKDHHIQCGEELFYQIKGDMLLKLVVKGEHRDVHIREGEMFLLPGRIPHSPQCPENVVGLVLERDRHPDTEKDGIRVFVQKDGQPTMESLYEKWFYADDLDNQIAPLIKGYLESEQYKTGKPIPGTIPENPPVTLDMTREVEAPFNFAQWLCDHSNEIDNKGKLELFDGGKYQFQIFVYGGGEVTDQTIVAETWMWQLEGSSDVIINGETRQLNKNDSVLVPQGQRFVVRQKAGSRTLVCYQDPTKASTWPKDA